YPFGFGLSYSSFRIDPAGMTDAPVSIGDVVEVRADVTNTGDRRADEVVQLYATDPVASVTRPVRELVAFQRVPVDPGATVRVVFEVPVEALGFTGRDLTYVVEPGLIEFHVGSSATDTTPAGTVTIAGTAPISAVRSTATRVAVTQPS